MKKKIYTAIWGLIFLTSIVPFVLYPLFSPLKKIRDKITRAFAFFYSRLCILAADSRFEVVGRENLPETNFLAVCNHQHLMDIPVIICAVPRKIGFVAKSELYKVPILAMWMRLLGCICLRRSSAKSSADAFHKGVRKLKSGQSLLVFPEGSRSRDGEVKKFKAGSFKMAVSAEVPVVPITCIGTNKLFSRNNVIKVIIHPAVSSVGKSTKELAEQTQEVVARELVVY